MILGAVCDTYPFCLSPVDPNYSDMKGRHWSATCLTQAVTHCCSLDLFSSPLSLSNNQLLTAAAQSAGAVEYTDCFSTEG